jgi:hypothetical protein
MCFLFHEYVHCLFSVFSLFIGLAILNFLLILTLQMPTVGEIDLYKNCYISLCLISFGVLPEHLEERFFFRMKKVS